MTGISDIYKASCTFVKHAKSYIYSNTKNGKLCPQPKRPDPRKTIELNDYSEEEKVDIQLEDNNPKKWGVRVYMHECDSVQHYMDILNSGSAYEKYRELRDNGVEDSLLYVETLGAYAADKKYFPKLKSIIKKLRTEYDIPQLN